MKRYCICKIIGDGQNTETAFRPAIVDVVDPITGFQAFNVSSVIATDPQTGHPIESWCLVIAAGDNFKLVADNVDVDLLPEVDLDVKVSAIHTPTKLEMGTKLQARGIDTSFVGNADGYRDVIKHLGKLQSPDFDEKSFDIAE